MRKNVCLLRPPKGRTATKLENCDHPATRICALRPKFVHCDLNLCIATIQRPKSVHCALNLCIATIQRLKSVHCDPIATPNNWSLSCPVGGLY